MQLSDFDFELPQELIALRPANPRSAARMLFDDGKQIQDRMVKDLPGLLNQGDLLVLNNTKVISAMLTGIRKRESHHGSGESKIEATLLSTLDSQSWSALVKPARRLALGDIIEFSAQLHAEVTDKTGGEVMLRFNLRGGDLDRAIEQIGAMPLPPYISARRAADDRDRIDYQTVFARRSGAVAAPTASLHFDDALVAALDKAGVSRTEVTLHVGAGTFLPVKSDDISQHKMHSEWGDVSPEAAAQIAAHRKNGGRVVAVGTTALRLIETAARTGKIHPFKGDTDIFITPGYEFHAASGLMTNFHLPKSTLLMLVAAFVGHERMQEIYAHAVNNRYRFFSYGDSSLLLPS